MKNEIITILMLLNLIDQAIGQQRVGIGITSPSATLDVARGSANGGTSIFRGTTYNSRFNYSTTEDTYIRGGKANSHILLNDTAGLGNVGIATNSPSFKLTVQTGSDNWGIVHTTGTIAVGTWVGNYSGITGGWYGTYSNHPLMFSTNNGGAQMTLFQNGDVGIGTTSPLGRLDVTKSAGGNSTAHFRGTTYGSIFNYSTAEDTYIRGGKNGSHVIINDGLLGNVGIGTTIPADKLSVLTSTSSYGFTHTDGAITVGSWVGVGGGWYGTKTNHPLNFFTNNGNAQMTIYQNGQVSMGAGAASSWTPRLTVWGRLAMIDGGAQWTFVPGGGVFGLEVAVQGSTIAYLDLDGDWGTFSDSRLKEDIRPYKPILDDIKNLNVSTYRYKSGRGKSRSFGLIAQEVTRYFPEIVSQKQDGDIPGLMGIAYAKTGVLAIKAIQEQQVIIESLQKRIENLEKKLLAIESLQAGNK